LSTGRENQKEVAGARPSQPEYSVPRLRAVVTFFKTGKCRTPRQSSKNHAFSAHHWLPYNPAKGSRTTGEKDILLISLIAIRHILGAKKKGKPLPQGARCHHRLVGRLGTTLKGYNGHGEGYPSGVLVQLRFLRK